MVPEVADDLQEFRALIKRRGPNCDLCRIVREMTDDHRDKLRRAFAAPDITDAAIAEWVTQRGYEWHNADTLSCTRRHRQQGHPND